MPDSVKKVLIVGGGTAGWLSALHLKTALGPTAEVTLVESPDVPTIGVGEGTQPTLRSQLQLLRVDEEECLRECGGSFKNGIRFVDWGGPGPRDYFHPFFSGPTGSQESPVAGPQLWLGLVSRGRADPHSLADRCFPETALIRQKRAPVSFQNGRRAPTAVVNYAYHVDAAKLGGYLRRQAVGRGVRHIADRVTAVRRSETGRLASVVTEANGELAAEFFVDCTGFRRLLIGELSDAFVDFDRYLFNDRAVTARIPYRPGGPTSIESCTTSTALKHGWVWEVPLRDRVGAGYVYSSRFVDDDAAATEFAAFLGFEPEQSSRIRFRSGHYRDQWAENCVSVGLSGGFLEPLEATGIALITYSLMRLAELWPPADFPPAFARKFNEVMRSSYQWVRDFLVMHYCFSRREDSEYWRAVRQTDAVPDAVREQMALLDHAWPFGEMSHPVRGFRLPDASFACVLAGFGRLPGRPNAYVQALSDQQLDGMMARLDRLVFDVPSSCPDHAEYLRRLANV